jgi:hypothetical protein
MSKGRNWDKHNRDARASRARQQPLSRVGARRTFEALHAYYLADMNEGGNFIVLPSNWQDLSDAELHSKRIAHREKDCAQNKQWFNYAAGDRWIRVSNETVEALDVGNCEICASFVKRN